MARGARVRHGLPVRLGVDEHDLDFEDLLQRRARRLERLLDDRQRIRGLRPRGRARSAGAARESRWVTTLVIDARE